MNSNLQFDFNNPSSNLGKKTVVFKTWATTFFEIKKKRTDDNLENNDQVIMSGLETGTFWVIGRHDKDTIKNPNRTK